MNPASRRDDSSELACRSGDRVVRAAIDRAVVQERDTAVGLGVEIDEERLASPHGERRGKIHGRGGLPHAAGCGGRDSKVAGPRSPHSRLVDLVLRSEVRVWRRRSSQGRQVKRRPAGSFERPRTPDRRSRRACGERRAVVQERDAAVGLWVEIDEECLASPHGERRRQDSRRWWVFPRDD